MLQVDGNQVTLTATASAAAYVEFHGFYDGYDEDNDGVTLDWHNFLHQNWGPGGTAQQATGATMGHLGTDATANAQGQYSTVWNLPEVENQSGVKFKIRIVDAQGNVREVAGGVSAPFTLQRSYSVESYVIPDFLDAGLYFQRLLPQLHSDEIELPTDLADVSRAFILGNYWNNPNLSINDTPSFPGVRRRRGPVEHVAPRDRPGTAAPGHEHAPMELRTARIRRHGREARSDDRHPSRRAQRGADRHLATRESGRARR